MPKALDRPTPMAAAPMKAAIGIAHIMKKSVAVLLYHDRPMVIIATQTLLHKLSWLILHERKAVFIVVSTLASMIGYRSQALAPSIFLIFALIKYA